VEAEIQRRLIPEILTKAAEYHCRKGLRIHCDCDYCQIKMAATVDIGNGYRWWTEFELPPLGPSQTQIVNSWEDRVERHRITVKALREQRRSVWRQELYYEKIKEGLV
jgi:hypothetical protein